jgi:phage terminase large subunit-like protein
MVLRDQWKPDEVIVEMAQTGYALCQEFRDERLGRLAGYKPLDDKETRFAVQMAKIEGGMFLIPREADWLRALSMSCWPSRMENTTTRSIAWRSSSTGSVGAWAVPSASGC